MSARMLTEAAGPFAYQLIGEEYVATREGAALQWGFSTGKSRVVLTRLVRDDRIRYTLMFCRLDNVSDLVKEIKKHTNVAYVELTGKNADVRLIVRRYSSCASSQRVKTIFLVNYDKARYLTQELMDLKAEAVVCDESTNIKHWKSQRTKDVCAIGHQDCVVFRCAMAGKMASQDLSNYWAQMFFVDKGVSLGKNWYWFQQDYYTKVGFDHVLKPGARDRLLKVVTENSSVMRTSDIRIPKRVNRSIKELTPTKQQMELFEQLTNYAVPTPTGDIWIPANGGVSFEKSNQVCGGYIQWPLPPVGTGEIGVFEDNPKKEALRALLEDEFSGRKDQNEPKIIICAFHTWEIEAISRWLRELEWDHCLLHGQQTAGDNAWSKNEFLNNPFKRILVSQADMLIGTNDLIVADTMIWYSNSNKVDSRDQAEARLDRPGQRSNVLNYIDLVLKEQSDHATALAVGFARMDVDGFMGTVKLMQEAKRRAAARGYAFQ